eukprot:gene10754-10766_t
MADSEYCRKCGKQTLTPAQGGRWCECVNQLMPDSEFCRKCGKRTLAQGKCVLLRYENKLGRTHTGSVNAPLRDASAILPGFDDMASGPFALQEMDS